LIKTEESINAMPIKYEILESHCDLNTINNFILSILIPIIINI
jgi:hypothetical protein